MAINLALRFCLEVCALISFAYWGVSGDNGLFIKWGAGIGSPLIIAVIWGVFVSPKAPLPIRGMKQVILEAVIFGLAAAALYSSGKPLLAIIFAITAVLNRLYLSIGISRES